MAIDVEQEIAEANARLPVALPDRPMPLDIQLRSIALAVAQRHVGDTCVKEGGLYQQLKIDNKLGDVVSVDQVLRTALVFERYLWGEFSKGIAENAIAAISTAAADAIEKEFEARSAVDEEFKDEPPIRPHSGDTNE
jgi:hypothetical protein